MRLEYGLKTEGNKQLVMEHNIREECKSFSFTFSFLFSKEQQIVKGQKWVVVRIWQYRKFVSLEIRLLFGQCGDIG